MFVGKGRFVYANKIGGQNFFQIPQPVLNTIATAVGEDQGTLEEVYEPFLIKEGFIIRTPRGREATDLAYRHLGLEKGNINPDDPTLF